MDKKQSLELYKLGGTAWNSWANEMLTQRAKLAEVGEWQAEVDPTTSKLRGKNPATQEWIAEARADFAEHCFDEANFANFMFPGETSFGRVSFSTAVTFFQARFSGKVEFANARFNGFGEFTNAKFNDDAVFDEVKFHNDAMFIKAEFGRNAVFANAIFDGDVEFEETIFTEHTVFKGTIFRGITIFNKARLSKVSFAKSNFGDRSVFHGTTFTGYAAFDKAAFQNEVVFSGATFTDEAGFSQAKFTNALMILETVFSDDVSFDQAIFEGFTSFLGTTFKKDASFVAMRGQSFFTLERSSFFLVPDFGQAHFAEAPRLDNSRFGISRTSVKTNVTGRWRSLKRLAVEGHDHERELNFLAEETKSLRAVQGIFWSGSGRYWMGLLYQLLSDFGRSVWRPLILWVIVTTVSPLYYLSHHSDFGWNKLSSIASLTCSGDSVTADPVAAALYLSVHNGLVISGLSRTEILAQSYACLYGHEGKDRVSPIMPYGVVFAGLAQTIFSAVLIFLFLLGLRNYFRIK